MKIVVYCSSQEGLEKKYQQLARDLGSWIGQHGHTLLYGGSNAGLMHITASAVHEELLENCPVYRTIHETQMGEAD